MIAKPNGRAEPRNRIRILALAFISFFGAAIALADEINITRVGACDWTCADAAGAQLSCHVRVDRAITACANRSLADGLEYRVIPAEYRVVATITVADTEPLVPISITWIPPTTNVDGTPIDGPLVFPLYLMAADWTQLGEPSEPVFSYQPDAAGTYTFAVAAKYVGGNESELSEPGSVVR